MSALTVSSDSVASGLVGRMTLAGDSSKWF